MRSLNWARGILVDLDGTLVQGGAVVPGASELLEQFENRFIVVSNNAEHMPDQLARALQRLGLRVQSDRIVLAGKTAIDLIAREQPKSKIMLFGSAALRAYAKRRGLWLSDDRPDIVLLARDRQFSFAKLAMAANAVRAGAALMATNPDLTHPGLNGQIVPETGTLLRAVLSCAGPVAYRVIGKPEPDLFQAGLALLAMKPADTVVIGDNPDTDGAGAQRLGLRFIHIEDGHALNNIVTVGYSGENKMGLRAQHFEVKG